MSISAEITRIQGAKTSLKSAIESYGVSVPDSAKIDEYSSYIGNIKTTTFFSMTISTLKWSNNTAVFTYNEYPKLNDIKDSSYIEFIAKDESAKTVVDNKVEISNAATGNITFSCAQVPSSAIQCIIKIIN